MAYFEEETINFLMELRFNNNREWFAANKERYNRFLKEPMERFGADVSDELNKSLAKYGVTLVPVPSRMNRDIRFSKDKSPYRDVKWVAFKPSVVKRWQDAPCLYFEIYPDSFGLGLGYQEANAKTMAAYRNAILASTPRFIRIVKKFNKQKTFVVGGENYKKYTLPEYPEIENWYGKKTIFFYNRSPIDDTVFSDDLAKYVADELKKLIDIYLFVLKLII